MNIVDACSAAIGVISCKVPIDFTKLSLDSLKRHSLNLRKREERFLMDFPTGCTDPAERQIMNWLAQDVFE